LQNKAVTGSRHLLVLAVIIAAGAVLRGFYLAESAHKPDFNRPMADAGFHDYWARALVSGDWSPPANDPDPHINKVPFVRPPGYPYFLAFAYAITGKSYVGARIVQMVLGLVNCWLAYLLGRAVFNRAVGLFSAAMMAGYWGLLYIEVELHDPTLLITLSLCFFLTIAAWLRDRRTKELVVAGALLGMMILVRPNVGIFLVAAAPWIWWQGRRQWKPAAVFVAAAFVAVLPATVRNLVVAGDPVLVSANGAINLYIGNNASADGVSTRIPDLEKLTGESGWSCYAFDRIVHGLGEREGRTLKYSEADRYFLRRGLAEIADAPARFVKLTARRAALFWGPAEVSNNKAVAVEKAESRVLRNAPGFAVFLGLAWLGVAIWARERRQSALNPDVGGGGALADLILLYVVAVFVSYLPFLVAERFRMPIMPYLFVFGSFGAWRLLASARAGEWSRAGMLAAAAVVLVVLCSRPLVAYEGDRAWWHTDRASTLATSGDSQGAMREYQLALKENPGYVDANLGLASLLAATGDFRGAMARYQTILSYRPDNINARLGLAAAMALSGKPAEAVVHLRQVVAKDPRSAPARFELGRALALAGDFPQAEIELRQAIQMAPEAGPAHLYLGSVLAARNDHPSAISEFRAALAANPRDPDAYIRLGGSLCAVDSTSAAEQAFARAMALPSNAAAVAAQIGGLQFEANRLPEAERWYREAVRLDPRDGRARANLALAIANLGRLPEAAREMRAAIAVEPANRIYAERLKQIEEMMAKKN
jgi:tetratricopeptide (TPR) repeat protein